MYTMEQVSGAVTAVCLRGVVVNTLAEIVRTMSSTSIGDWKILLNLEFIAPAKSSYFHKLTKRTSFIKLDVLVIIIDVLITFCSKLSNP